ncbi:MAG: TraE/TraK family type IV conjugative transfer system protein [Succinatimonas hippei]|nr:TraE/TraK family type IV conjugative transfer system protein [Succinatimonas hippei]
MDYSLLKATFSRLTTGAWIARSTLVAEAIAVGFLGYLALNNKTTVAVIPWTLQYPTRITEDTSDLSYKIAWGQALANLFGNVNYSMVDTIEKRIKPLLEPESTEATVKALRRQAEQFKENRITVRYEVTQAIAEHDKIFIEGSYYIKAPGVAERRHIRTYEFILGMHDYQPRILYMNTYEDHARTDVYLAKLKREKELRRKAEEGDAL